MTTLVRLKCCKIITAIGSRYWHEFLPQMGWYLVGNWSPVRVRQRCPLGKQITRIFNRRIEETWEVRLRLQCSFVRLSSELGQHFSQNLQLLRSERESMNIPHTNSLGVPNHILQILCDFTVYQILRAENITCEVILRLWQNSELTGRGLSMIDNRESAKKGAKISWVGISAKFAMQRRGTRTTSMTKFLIGETW